MLQETLITNKSAVQAVWRIYFALAALQTGLALALLFQTQSADSAGLVLGISPIRLVFALGLAAVLLLLVWLLLETWIRPQTFERHWGLVAGFLGRRQVWNGIVTLCSAFFLLGLISVVQLAEVEEPFARAFFDRLAPLVIWVVGLSGQTVIALLTMRHGRETLSLRPQGRLFYLLLLAFAAIFLGWSWVASTVMPTESQRVGWNILGVPIVGWQVLVAWLAGVLMLAALAYLDSPSPGMSWLKRFALRRLDLLVVLLIWLAAVVVWQSMPLSPSWFLSEPVSPNYEYYPSSDALAYDVMAQSALVGEGYRFYSLLYARRPLLAMYLTALRLLGGQDYPRVVFLQILVLAWIPVLVYVLTKALHNRISGVIAASLIIIREANSVLLTERITTSHVKLLMADLPSMLVTVLFILLAVIWLKNLAERKLLALISGGALGFAMLVRPEVFVFVFPLLLLSAVILRQDRQWRLWLQGCLLFSTGLLLVISPWIWRNYSVTGEIFFDNPLHNTGLILQRFRLAPEAPTPTKTAQAPLTATPAPPSASKPALLVPPIVLALQETPTPAPTPSTPNERLQREMNRALNLVLQDPGAILQSSLAHYLNSQVQSFLVLPSAFRGPESLISWIGHRSADRLWEDCCSLRTYIRQVSYWRQWDGRFTASALVALVLNLVLIAYGVNEAWKRNRWAGIAPLALVVTYLVANALFRNSGGRYILPIDWAVLVYFSVGLAQLTMVGVAYLRGAPVVEKLIGEAEPALAPSPPLLRSWRFYAAIIGLFLLGCAAPALEASFPMRYDQARREAMVLALLRTEQLTKTQRGDLHVFLSRGGIAFAGRALYPRYFAPDEGDPGTSKKNPFAPKPYPRIAFYLAGSPNWTMALPIDGEPSSFPNGQDVLVLGCNQNDILLVAPISAEGTVDQVYLRSHLPAKLKCPLPVIPGVDD